MEKQNEFLGDVIGMMNVKEELKTICDWYNDDELLNNPKVTLPAGILFWGRPGCGKTLIMRELSKAFNCEVFVVEDTKDPIKEITDKYDAARKCKKAVLIIDEIVSLIGKDSRVLRCLLTELDGFRKSGLVFTMASTNNFLGIPGSFFRKGRFDRKIQVSEPDSNDRFELYKSFLMDLNINIRDEEIKYVSSLGAGILNCSTIKQICNDAFLLHKEKTDVNDLIRSYSRIALDEYIPSAENNRDYRVAIHEAGHCMMAKKYSKDFRFFKASFNKRGGQTNIYEVDEDKTSIEKKLEEIDINLGGMVAEEIVYKQRGIGFCADESNALEISRFLIRCLSINGRQYSREGESEASPTSNQKRVKCERKAEHFLNKRERLVKRYIKRNKKELIRIADEFYNSKTGELNSLDCFNDMSKATLVLA